MVGRTGSKQRGSAELRYTSAIERTSGDLGKKRRARRAGPTFDGANEEALRSRAKCFTSLEFKRKERSQLQSWATLEPIDCKYAIMWRSCCWYFG